MKISDSEHLDIILSVTKETIFYAGCVVSTVENNQFLGFNARPAFSLVAVCINKN